MTAKCLPYKETKQTEVITLFVEKRNCFDLIVHRELCDDSLTLFIIKKNSAFRTTECEAAWIFRFSLKLEYWII